MANQSTKDQALESTTATSTKAPREAGQIAKQMSGKKSTALDSTVETSTTAPRSAEEIMKAMEEEDKQANASTKSKAKSTIKSTVNKWKSAGVNARKTVTEAEDTVGEVKDVVAEVGTIAGGGLPGIDDQRGSVSGPLSSVASAVAVGTSIYNATIGGDNPGVDTTKTVPAPTDASIIAFQQHQTQAQLSGVPVKKLAYTDAQQSQWNAQDQYRMYSNYGDMYEHGQNEMGYNMAILNSAMAMHAPVAKELPKAPSFRQKFLAEMAKDDDQMDINNLTAENMMAHSAELLNTGFATEASEDLAFVNRGRDTKMADKFAAVDHDLDGRTAEKTSVENAFARAAESKNNEFTANLEKRMASLSADLGLDKLQSTQPELSDEFF